MYNNKKRKKKKKKKNNNNNNMILKFHWRQSLNYTLRSRNANNCLAVFFKNIQWSKNPLFSSLNNIYAGMSYSQSYFFLILSFQFSINRAILSHTFLWLFLFEINRWCHPSIVFEMSQWQIFLLFSSQCFSCFSSQ